MASGQQIGPRRPKPLGLRGIRATPFEPRVEERNLARSVIPPAVPVRRVGLMRPHLFLPRRRERQRLWERQRLRQRNHVQDWKRER
jgi:hypothetical protein